MLSGNISNLVVFNMKGLTTPYENNLSPAVEFSSQSTTLWKFTCNNQYYAVIENHRTYKISNLGILIYKYSDDQCL